MFFFLRNFLGNQPINQFLGPLNKPRNYFLIIFLIFFVLRRFVFFLPPKKATTKAHKRKEKKKKILSIYLVVWLRPGQQITWPIGGPHWECLGNFLGGVLEVSWNFALRIFWISNLSGNFWVTFGNFCGAICAGHTHFFGVFFFEKIVLRKLQDVFTIFLLDFFKFHSH